MANYSIPYHFVLLRGIPSPLVMLNPLECVTTDLALCSVKFTMQYVALYFVNVTSTFRYFFIFLRP